MGLARNDDAPGYLTRHEFQLARDIGMDEPKLTRTIFVQVNPTGRIIDRVRIWKVARCEHLVERTAHARIDRGPLETRAEKRGKARIADRESRAPPSAHIDERRPHERCIVTKPNDGGGQRKSAAIGQREVNVCLFAGIAHESHRHGVARGAFRRHRGPLRRSIPGG